MPIRYTIHPPETIVCVACTLVAIVFTVGARLAINTTQMPAVGRVLQPYTLHRTALPTDRRSHAQNFPTITVIPSFLFELSDRYSWQAIPKCSDLMKSRGTSAILLQQGAK